jgi:ubiquinone/menaquinone biosynthesis C-methylase UbiE
MEPVRKPFQGVGNIVRFNWHLYVLSLSISFTGCLVANFFSEPYRLFLYLFCILVLSTTLISLMVSFYIYDLSGLYKFDWLDDELKNTDKIKIVNINAGFDETSTLLKDKFSSAELMVLDFYDPLTHTEISIKRARKAYPSFPATVKVTTTNLPLEDNSADYVFMIFAAHEIREEKERMDFFREINRVVKPTGQVIVVEHLRDVPNFLAYTIGFLHFHTASSWLKTFQASKLKIKKEIKLTPFISTFILDKNGNTL